MTECLDEVAGEERERDAAVARGSGRLVSGRGGGRGSKSGPNVWFRRRWQTGLRQEEIWSNARGERKDANGHVTSTGHDPPAQGPDTRRRDHKEEFYLAGEGGAHDQEHASATMEVSRSFRNKERGTRGENAPDRKL